MIPPLHADADVEAENSCNCACPSNCCFTKKVKHEKECHRAHITKKTEHVAKEKIGKK